MWFAVGEKVPCLKFQEYFTSKAVRHLIKDKMIQIVFHEQSTERKEVNS